MLGPILLVYGTLAGAIGRRWAGGLLSVWLKHDIGDQPARAIQGLLIGSIVLLAGEPWYVALAASVAGFVGATVGFWGAMGMAGRKDIPLLIVHGVGATAPLGLVLWLFGYDPIYVLLAGPFRAAAYMWAWAHPWDIRWLGCQSDDPPPTAELLSGAAMGLGVALALI